jgi:hypothetical protein
MLSSTRMNTNIQASQQNVLFMVDGVPLITLVKAKELDERPPLSDALGGLEQTLSMLCSFLSLDDFLQFLSSPSFVEFSRTPEPWVQFELGLYADHTKTLHLIPEERCITLADQAMTGALDGGVWTGEADESMKAVLVDWVAVVSHAGQ